MTFFKLSVCAAVRKLTNQITVLKFFYTPTRLFVNYFRIPTPVNCWDTSAIMKRHRLEDLFDLDSDDDFDEPKRKKIDPEPHLPVIQLQYIYIYIIIYIYIYIYIFNYNFS